MTNERFLIVAYFLCLAFAAALGMMVYLILRRSFGALVESGSAKRLPLLLKRLFPCGLLLPVLLGFFTVSYQGCSRRTYEEIVQDHWYVEQKSKEQISSAMQYVALAILFWDAVLVVTVRLSRKDEGGVATARRRNTEA
jgi:hypothetical protein